MKKKLTTLILMTALLLTGCAGSKSGEKEPETGGEVNVPEFTLAGTYKEGKPEIYLIVKKNNSYFKVMFDAAEDAAEVMDCNIYYGNSEDSKDWEVQEKLMDIAAQNGAAAIILAPDDTTKLAPKVEELYASGVAMIFVDAVVNTGSYDICYMTDNFVAGERAAEEMLAHLRDSGLSESESAQIAIQIGRASSQTINDRLAGFCRYWEQNAPKSWTIIDDVKSNDGEDSKAYGVAKEYFEQYTDIRGVFATNNGSTKGFTQYMTENGLKNVVIVGFDYSDEIAALIESDEYTASVMLQNQYDMAYKGIQAAVDIQNGSFSTESKVSDTGVIAVNNENIKDPQIKEIIERN